MIKTIDFWSRVKAEHYKFNSNDIVISITDPGQILAKINNMNELLRVQFFDITDENKLSKFGYGIFKTEHAEKILNFINKKHTENVDYNLIVHCEAGISRSAAIALFSSVVTEAEFKTKAKTAHANVFIVSVLSQLTEKDIIIPEPKATASGIILF